MHSLYAVENAVTVYCDSCQRPIDLWAQHGLEIRRAGVTNHPNIARRLCPECLLRTVPPEQRQNLAGAYELHRTITREAGIPSSATTYLLSNEGKPRTWSDGYVAVGYAVHILGWDSSSDIRRHLTIVPQDPSDRPWSFVFFAATVFHRHVTSASLKLIWPFHDLSLLEQFQVVNGGDSGLRDSDFATITRGRRFWQETVAQGRTPDDPQERCRAFQEELPGAIYRARDAREERGDLRHGDLSQRELAEKFGWHEDTLASRLRECGVDWTKTRRRLGSRVSKAIPT